MLYFHIIDNSNATGIFTLLFLLFLFIDKMLIKIGLGSKLIISIFILKEIILQGKYLSDNFITGNAVEYFIIESLYLLNTIVLLTKCQKKLY